LKFGIISKEHAMAEHHHDFAEGEWPFQDAVNKATFSTTRVFRESYPILLVTHDDNGDWQILCGTTNDSKHAMIVSLGEAFKKDRSIGELADLPVGWQASRKTPNSPWKRFPSQKEQTSLWDRFLRLRHPGNK
jgi:hypothetical protein